MCLLYKNYASIIYQLTPNWLLITVASNKSVPESTWCIVATMHQAICCSVKIVHVPLGSGEAQHISESSTLPNKNSNNLWMHACMCSTGYDTIEKEGESLSGVAWTIKILHIRT